jgi:mono/diheme cytochrome c family protein
MISWRALAALLLLVACGPPRFPPPNLSGDGDVSRGAYLAEHVALCVTCHSERDWRYLGGPVVPGTEGQGGRIFNELFKVPPEVSIPAPNITPAGVGEWTDGELGRAITGGLTASGTSIFPGHPYFQYRHLSKPDVEALVAWLRTLTAGERALPARDLVYGQVAAINDALPMKAHLVKTTPTAGSVAGGRYLARLGSCKYCHTPTDRLGFPLPGRDWSGGTRFAVAAPGGGRVVVPNISPDDETGIGRWSREDFVRRFKAATPEVVREREVSPGGFNSPMPWAAYSGMTDEDLGSIYDYLRTQRPKRNPLPRYEPDAP